MPLAIDSINLIKKVTFTSSIICIYSLFNHVMRVLILLLEDIRFCMFNPNILVLIMMCRVSFFFFM